MLGLGSNISKTGKLGVHDLGIVTSNLVLKHNYDLSPVQLLSDGAGYFANNGYIDCGTDSNLAIGNGNCTMSAWVYSDDFTASYGYVLAIGNDATGGSFGFGVRSNQGMFVSAYSSPIVETAFNVPEGVWNHIAVVYTGGATDEAAFYCNGVLVETESIATNVTTGKITIGSNVASTGQFDTGYICNVGIWEAALDQDEVKSIMNKNYAGLTSSEKTDLVSWWNLDSVIDSVGASTAVYDNHYAGGSELGAELVTDGSFANGLDSWTSANVTLSGSSVILYDDSSDYVFQNISYDDGEVYAFTFGGTGDIRTRVGHSGAAATQIDVTLPATIYRLVDSDANRVQVYGSSDDSSATLTSVSVKLVNGNTGTLS